jgi:hypothetical protein
MTYMNTSRKMWVALTACVLFVTVYGFDGKPNSDIGTFLAWVMLGLTAPLGLLVPLFHVCLYEAVLLSIPTSYLSLSLDWLGFFMLGYLQWFKLVPFLIRCWKSHNRDKKVSSHIKNQRDNHV